MTVIPLDRSIRKVLVLGSGAIKIAEAGEFDYSGSQAIKALREEGIEAVLVNPNVATIQTDTSLTDKVYLLPVTPKYVERVIEAERPDGVLLGFGGQTALNCGFMLKKMGVFEKYGVKVLGTSVEAIERASDRAMFKKTMMDAGINVLESREAYTLEQAFRVAEQIGYPVIVRTAFTLGGRGGGVARNPEELEVIVRRGLAHSIVSQVLIERYIGHWKQVEFEVMRDSAGNSVTVCDMENILSMRVHTGDNTVVAPSQTLTNDEYHMLREVSMRAAAAVGVIGECNVQFALDPQSKTYYVIEMNPRLSRSSALASKATGYPIAYVAAKLALGYTLNELKNSVTGITTAAFEPSLDYVVVKMPRFEFSKYPSVKRQLGTQMKSIGEVMGIGRTFEEALQKAVRMLDSGREGVCDYKPLGSKEKVLEAVSNPTDEFFYNLAEACAMGVDTEELYRRSWVDRWFIERVRSIVEFDKKLMRLAEARVAPSREVLLQAKRLGFSDNWIAKRLGLKPLEVRELRKKLGVLPSIKRVDSLSAEWPAKTNYFYVTYDGRISENTGYTQGVKRIVVLGAGVYRIGSSVEFDWSTMNMVWALQKRGYEVTVVNCNPETVSTDYDMSDKLYFEELSVERVLDIYEAEQPLGLVCSVGGQTSNNLVPQLYEYGVRILGTSPESIMIAEDRARFSALLDSLGIPQPEWVEARSAEEVRAFAREKYPVILRPSFVLSGQAMRVVWDEHELEDFLREAKAAAGDYSVSVSRFIRDAREVEVDAVGFGSRVFVGALIEHIENAGVHSGDAVMHIPAEGISEVAKRKILDYTEAIGRALKVSGPFNVQFIVKGDQVYVIECNLRSSRSMPYVSKFRGVNLIELAAQAILGEEPPQDAGQRVFEHGVKAPQFSFMQLEGSDPVLDVEMRSTGEVAGFGNTFEEAFTKAMEAVGYSFNVSRVLVDLYERTPKAKRLVEKLVQLGVRVYVLDTKRLEYLEWLGEEYAGLLEAISVGDVARSSVDLVVSTPPPNRRASTNREGYELRRRAVELLVPLITNLETAAIFFEVCAKMRREEAVAITPLKSAT
ncbi:MAG: carbamoyl-phosphate synthase (glutamine-hydrolyzing) large subunit [Thermoprotei archaeon]